MSALILWIVVVYGKLMKILHNYKKRDSTGIVSNLMANAAVLHHATVLKC